MWYISATMEMCSATIYPRKKCWTHSIICAKEIPHHILFMLEHEGKAQAWIGYKEHSKSPNAAFKPGTYYHTDWLAPADLNLRIEGLNMDKVYENLIRQIAGNRLGGEDVIKDAVINAERRQKLEKEIAALEKKILREKQFNRQVEMNGELKRLRAELEGL
jgi:hypothetical protein